MIPLGAVASLEERLGPQNVIRFNMMPSVKILGNPPPGYSSGQAMNTMERLSQTNIPASMSFAWSDLSIRKSRLQPDWVPCLDLRC